MAGVNYANAIHFQSSDPSQCWAMFSPIGGDGSTYYGLTGVTGLTGFSDFQKGMISVWINMDGYPTSDYAYALCDWAGNLAYGGNSGGVLDLDITYGFNSGTDTNIIFSCSPVPYQSGIQFTSSTTSISVGGWTAFPGIAVWSGTNNANLGAATIDGSGYINVPRTNGIIGEMAAVAKIYIPSGGHDITVDMCFIDVDTGAPVPGTEYGPTSIGPGTNYFEPGFVTLTNIPTGTGNWKVYPAYKVSGSPTGGSTIGLSLNADGTNGNNVQTGYLVNAIAFDPPPNDGQWHHICCAYDLSRGSSGVVVYVDGNLKTGTPFTAVSGADIASDEVFNIGTAWGAQTIPGGDLNGSGQLNISFNGDMTELWAMYGDNGVGIDFVGSLPGALDYFTTNIGGQLYATSLGCAGPAFMDQLWSAGDVLAPQLYLAGGVIGWVEQTSQQNSSSSGPIYTDTNFNNYNVNYTWWTSTGPTTTVWPTFALTDPFPKYNNSGPFDGGGGNIASGPATIGAVALGGGPLGSDSGLT